MKKKRIEQDISQIICHNYDKKQHYVSICRDLLKKLAAVLAATTSMIQAKTEAKIMAPIPIIDNFTLLPKHFPCIYHQVCFEKDQANVQALLDSGS